MKYYEKIQYIDKNEKKIKIFIDKMKESVSIERDNSKMSIGIVVKVVTIQRFMVL